MLNESTSILTHRGLEPTRAEYYAESSYEAFSDQLSRGYGLEFDVKLTRDSKVVVLHDNSLVRYTNGADARLICEVDASELLEMRFNDCRLTSLEELLSLITEQQEQGVRSALHLKHDFQEPDKLGILLECIEEVSEDEFFIFDVKVPTAKYLKERRPDLILAPSVAHPYDIARYNEFVGGTLLSLETTLAHRELFSLVWMDEWDRSDTNGTNKTFYNAENFAVLRQHDFKIGLVTPELHATSPNLLGGESHPDAASVVKLKERLEAILVLKPDFVCTDHPDLVRELASEVA